MNDQCETCGWFQLIGTELGICLRQAPPSGRKDEHQRFADWPQVENWQGCGEHTAVQRRRDRLMLAGQAMAGLAWAHYKDLTTYADIAHDCCELADAILTKAEGEHDLLA